ncbi:hypothetical protein KAR91_17355 [Candidatus Pacearchaeota archaeon]|nr:hypothetical protein [Candidatus Pacearchaeota archaeon]
MTAYNCELCKKELINTNSGEVFGCEHYTKEAILDLSNKQLANGSNARSADKWALNVLREMDRNR